MDFDAWGNVLDVTDPNCTVGGTALCFQPFGFVGGLWEPSTGMVRFGARDYDPMAGRWTQKDPIGFDGGQENIYEYVGDDPINGIDPNGKLPSAQCLTYLADTCLTACQGNWNPSCIPGCFLGEVIAATADPSFCNNQGSPNTCNEDDPLPTIPGYDACKLACDALWRNFGIPFQPCYQACAEEFLN
jgi:RHS repeat-associated protein